MCSSAGTRGGESPAQPYRNVGGSVLGKTGSTSPWGWWLSALGKLGLSHDTFGITALWSSLEESVEHSAVECCALGLAEPAVCLVWDCIP